MRGNRFTAGPRLPLPPLGPLGGPGACRNDAAGGGGSCMGVWARGLRFSLPADFSRVLPAQLSPICALNKPTSYK